VSENEQYNDIRLVGHEHAKILVVDDNADLLKLITIRLRPFMFDLRTASSAEEALSILAVWPADLVITDLQMPGMSGIELFEHLQEKSPLLPVIILTAHGTIPEAVEATQSGVATYLTKPFESEVLVKEIQVALFSSGFVEPQTISSHAIVHDESWRKDIISNSSSMRSVLAHVDKLAESDAIVVLEGEPGVGKEDVARALHLRSQRSHMPFVKINCAAISDESIVSEFFGIEADHENGVIGKSGKLQAAFGGTILLSDYSEAPPFFLRKVLHALNEGQASPVNSSKTYQVNVRVVATTATLGGYDQADAEFLDLATKAGVADISVPPLRDRREDIPLIINHWLRENGAALDTQFAPAAIQLMLAAEWPGNVRQLVNVVKMCTRLSNTKIVPEALVASRIDSPAFKIKPLTNAHREFERNYLTELLKVSNGNVTRAASIAKRNRTEFHRLIKKHQIDAKTFRQNSNT
jgi:two-component system response regulator GlrR